MARRGSNEGSVYRRADGRWAASVTLGYEGERRVRKSFYGRTRREVAEKLATALRDHQHGLPLPGDRVTVGAFVERWLAGAEARLRPLTYRSYTSIAREHLIPDLGRIALVKLTPAEVQKYVGRKLAAGLSPYTVRNHHALLRRALADAVRWGEVQRNVATIQPGPRIIRTEVRPLSPDEARKFLDAVTGERLEAMYSVALGLGLRQGEVLGLGWDDVDLDAGMLHVRKTLQRYEKAYHLGEPKTAKSRRSLGLPAPLIDALRAQGTRQKAERVRAGSAWEGARWGLVFCNELGAPLSGSSVTHAFQAQLEAAGLPRQRFHDLRHAAASFMLAQGVPMRTAMEVLGHSEIATTMNLYSHVAPEMQRDATERTARLLWGAS
ncbi:MAG: tyrosine-type recombinase/integrase [Tepidiformaceae bacterium]